MRTTRRTKPQRATRSPTVIVGDILRPGEPSLREHTDLAEAVSALVATRLGALPVLAADRTLVGVVSEGDLLRVVVGASHERVVADVMTRGPVTAAEQQPLEEIAELFVRLPWRTLPVVGQGVLVGVVARTDVVAALLGPHSPPKPLSPDPPMIWRV
jgi:CBS domain-containing protein